MKPLAWFATFCFVAILAVQVVLCIRFNRDCEGHLKRAADANSIAIARTELKVATAYLEAHGLTSGYTSVLYNTPDEDVGFWYGNLKSAENDLYQSSDDLDQLTRSNLLMKLRETLLDHGQSGDSVTSPDGIAVFPNNVAFAWSTLVLCIATIIGQLGAYGSAVRGAVR